MIKKIIFSLAALLNIFLLPSCAADENIPNNAFAEMNPIGSMKLEYAKMFSVDYYENGISLITIKDSQKYLLIPPNSKIPENLPENITIIKQPVNNIYLAASSAMDLFDGINSLDSIRMTSTKKDDWSLSNIKKAMADKKIIYAGKYSSPDYEIILSENCSLAVESTMIYHTPYVKEQLESYKIPVMVEYSSYETNPLGRMEWIKLYGLLLGKENEADIFFNEKSQQLKNIYTEENEKNTAAFFYISSNGSVNVRKPGDYISKMIELAGGRYIFSSGDLNTDGNALSAMNIQFETFYSKAKDADFIFYNGSVDGGISSIAELIEKNSLFSDFKAVKNNNAWCTDKNMFQQTTGVADIISDMNKIFKGNKDNNLIFFYKLS